jgi:hypothetical protein
MIYWLGVYTLVIIGGIAPFVLLYVASLLLWLGFGAIRSMAQTLKHTLAVRRNSLTALPKGTFESTPV